LANIYLDALDHELAGAGYEMVRYADDLVILCRTRAEADRALAHLTRWTTAAGLQLHPTKTRVVEAAAPGGFDFLGYHFERGYRWPRQKSRRAFKDRVRQKTRRTQGHTGGHHRGREPHGAGLVSVFSTQPLDHLRPARPVGAHAVAQHPSQTARPPRAGTRHGPPALA
jgi:hypothetical protein